MLFVFVYDAVFCIRKWTDVMVINSWLSAQKLMKQSSEHCEIKMMDVTTLGTTVGNRSLWQILYYVEVTLCLQVLTKPTCMQF